MHDCNCAGVHQFQRTFVVWLLKPVSVAELRESFAVNTHNDPALWKQNIMLFKVFDIFILAVGHGDPEKAGAGTAELQRAANQM